MSVDQQFSGYWRGPETWIGTYVFLRLYPQGYYTLTQVDDAGFDFPGFLSTLDLMSMTRSCEWGGMIPRRTGRREQHWWGRFTRETNVPALNIDGVEVKRLPDALILYCRSDKRGEFRFMEVEIVEGRRLRPSHWNVDLNFVPEEPAGPGAAADGGRDPGSK